MGRGQAYTKTAQGNQYYPMPKRGNLYQEVGRAASEIAVLAWTRPLGVSRLARAIGQRFAKSGSAPNDLDQMRANREMHPAPTVRRLGERSWGAPNLASDRCCNGQL